MPARQNDTLRALPHIFEPFDTPHLEDGGSGLGRSVVHGIVGDHGGKLEVEAASEGGARIRVLLPLSQGSPNVSA